MRICFMMAAVLALGSAALAADRDRPTAILVSPIHEAQVVRGDDGMDHVEYELLVVSVFPEPVTLTSVTVLDPARKKLMQIEGAALAAATQTLFARTASAVIPASAAVSVDVDLILPPNTVPERVTHKIAYALKADSELAPMITSQEVDAPQPPAGNRNQASRKGGRLAREHRLLQARPQGSSHCRRRRPHRDRRNLRYRLGKGLSFR